MKRNYDDPVYKDWRVKVYKRDNFKCQMPGCKRTKNLNAHHIQKRLVIESGYSDRYTE